jgi:hypothetical protein
VDEYGFSDVHAKVSSNSKINTDQLCIWSLTNTDCNAETVAHVYKALWAVEDGFPHHQINPSNPPTHLLKPVGSLQNEFVDTFGKSFFVHSTGDVSG